MNKNLKRVLKLALTSIFLMFTFSSCSKVINEIAHKAPNNHKRINGSNDFQALMETLVEKSLHRLKADLSVDEVVLVSDFVNIDKLKNRSNLGFLLSDQLKNELLNNNIIVRQIELGEDFQFGNRGFNLLTRNQNDINKKYVDNASYAFVGTYTMTTQNLIVFVKLIDIRTGNILSSSTAKTSMDEEIEELEGLNQISVRQPMVL